MNTSSRKTSLFTVLFASAALALGAAACSSSDDDNKGNAPNGGEYGNGNGNGNGGGNGGGNYTLDNVCEQAAARQCAEVQDCCNSSGVGYDEAGCLQHARSNCEREVNLAKEGKRTFNPGAVDGCLSVMGTFFAKCEMTFAELMELDAVGDSCGQIFAGTAEEGQACEDTEDCKPTSDAKKYASCEEGQCVHVPTGLGEGEACRWSGDCDGDLYCEYAGGDEGKCEKRVKTGDACSGGSFSDQCELGSYCDGATSACVAAKAVGEACQIGIECASMNCSAGQCDEPTKLSFADAETCKGEANPSGDGLDD